MSLSPGLIQQASGICKYVLVKKVWEEDGTGAWMWAAPKAVKPEQIGDWLGCWKAKMEGWWDTRCVFTRGGSECPAGPVVEAQMTDLRNKESEK